MTAIAVQEKRHQPTAVKSLPAISNAQIAAMLSGFANAIKDQPDNQYRAQAFRKAALTISKLDQSVSDLFAEQGSIGLMSLPGIGQCLSAVLAEIVETGHWRQYDHLKPREKGTNEAPRGIEPSAALLLRVDKIYREKAAAGVLETIAPTEFNPAGRQWLPVLKISVDGWTFTAMFSNSLQAHQHGRVRDWVVIHFSRDASQHGKRTVVTAMRGSARGHRVVRGRETESRPNPKKPPVKPSPKATQWQQMALKV